MPKRTTDIDAQAFGRRLVNLLEQHGQPRRGAGADLARRYKVASVTANAWLNGEYKPSAATVRKIAADFSTTFDALYFGDSRAAEDAATYGDPQIDAKAITELRIAVSMVAQALADSIPSAGHALLSALDSLPPALRDDTFLADIRHTVHAELQAARDPHAPARRVPEFGKHTRP